MFEECCWWLLHPSSTTLCCWWSWDHANTGCLPWKEVGGSRITGGSTVLDFCCFLNFTSQPQPESRRKSFGRIHCGCSLEQGTKLFLTSHSWRHLTSSHSYLPSLSFFRLVQKRKNSYPFLSLSSILCILKICFTEANNCYAIWGCMATSMALAPRALNFLLHAVLCSTG